MVRFYSARESGITSLSALLAAVAELADALDSNQAEQSVPVRVRPAAVKEKTAVTQNRK